MRALCLLLSILLATPAAAQEEPRIHASCLGGAWQSCFILIDGPIRDGITDRLKQMVAAGEVRGRVVYLNSPGGSLQEGLRMGRYFREMHWDTTIGSLDGVPRNPDGSPAFASAAELGPGHCESACSYAFLGGENRAYQDNDKLGFHQFYNTDGDIGDGLTQQFSGLVVSYMVEMGVDARIFSLAATQGPSQMFYVDRNEAMEFDIVNRRGFDALTLEPFGNGIIAISKRLDPAKHQDGADLVTFFCRGGQPYAMLHTAHHMFLPGAQGTPAVWFTADKFDVPADALSLQISGPEAKMTLRLPFEIATELTRRTDFSIWISYGRLEGGTFTASRETSQKDREMIAAAFRYCIG